MTTTDITADQLQRAADLGIEVADMTHDELAAAILDEEWALALGVAMLLALSHQAAPPGHGLRLPAGLRHTIHALGRTSYALFLVHFPVLMLGNALYARWPYPSPWLTATTLLGTWGASVLLGLWFERRVETPLAARAGAWISGLGGRRR